MLPFASFGQMQPDDLPGLEMWLRSDTGVTTIGNGVFVSQWDDISGNNNHCTNPIGGNFMPGPELNVLNGYPGIAFYGLNDFLDFPEINNIRTVFWLIKEDAAANNSVPRCLLGHHTLTDFYRGPEKQLWSASTSSSNVLNGTTKVNFQEVIGTEALVPTDYAIISLVTTGDVSASSLTMNQNQFSHVWSGIFIELIVYSTQLTPEQTEQIENYLADRYTTPFAASDDILVPYGFCDTTLTATSGYDNYLWSTGETSNEIVVNNSGDFWVEVTDRFQRILRDTVHVEYAGFTQQLDEIICFGETFTWDTELPADDYILLWYDNSTGTSNSFFNEGTFSLQITDTSGCVLNTSLQLNVDSLSQDISLGADLQLCSGNSISLLLNQYNNLEFQWSNDSTLSSIIIENSGDYWVEVTDENDCQASDTIHVEIVGTAPQIGFEAAGLCEGSPTLFSAINISLSNIISWNWTFDDESTATGQNVSHQYNTPGDFYFTLEATTAEGCSSLLEGMVHVNQLPESDFTNSIGCNNSLTAFTSTGTSTEGVLSEWQWLIDGVNYSGEDIDVLLPESGFHNISLTVVSEFGCTNTHVSQVEIKPSPQSGFSYSAQCFGDLTLFNEEVNDSESGPISSFQWNFGDGTGSFLPNPSHFFVDDGVFMVQLIAIAQNSCRDTLIQMVQILPPPQVDFLVINACVGQPILLQDLTDASGLQIVEWNWTIESIGDFNIQNPEVIFENTGLFSVELSVLTEGGCSGEVQQSVPVWEVPVPEFSFAPEIMAAPANIQFNNQSTGANQFHWDFGDNSFSDEINPLHTFSNNGTYTVVLKAENAAGCFETISKDIIIDDPFMDLLVEQVICTTTSTGTSITALVVNNGNVKVEGLSMSWILGNDAPVSENWNGTIAPGNSTQFTFSSQMNPGPAQFPYACVTAMPAAAAYSETNTSNNTFCKSLSNDGFELFPPYPNPGQNVMFVRFTSPFQADLEIRIIDKTGRICKSWNDSNVPTGFHEYFMDISGLADGNYTLELIQSGRHAVQSFMKLTSE